VSSIDPIKVYFTLNEQEYLNCFRRTSIESQSCAGSGKFELVLLNGATYPLKGRFFVADRQVDQKTGAIRMAGLFPNPGNILHPGEHAKIRAVSMMMESALLVPQRAVTELDDRNCVAVVGSDNQVSIRSVKVGDRVGLFWVIEEGLQPGEMVVAEGARKVSPDAVVKPRPLAAPLASAEQQSGF
jgi:membrane fusion protein (multidrug efflux system)